MRSSVLGALIIVALVFSGCSSTAPRQSGRIEPVPVGVPGGVFIREVYLDGVTRVEVRNANCIYSAPEAGELSRCRAQAKGSLLVYRGWIPKKVPLNPGELMIRTERSIAVVAPPQ